MSSIIITPTDAKEMELLLSLFAKMKVKNRIVESSELEDFLFGLAMTDADRNEKVTESDIMAQIQSKL